VTVPSSRVVYLCEQGFWSIQRRHPQQLPYLVIHEVLHAAGLGENPPSSEAITRAVEWRCAGAR
jgi:hypothetical protein